MFWRVQHESEALQFQGLVATKLLHPVRNCYQSTRTPLKVWLRFEGDIKKEVERKHPHSKLLSFFNIKISSIFLALNSTSGGRYE